MFDSFLNLSEIDPDDNHFEIFDRNVSSPYLTISEYNSHEMHQNSSLILYNFNIRSGIFLVDDRQTPPPSPPKMPVFRNRFSGRFR